MCLHEKGYCILAVNCYLPTGLSDVQKDLVTHRLEHLRAEAGAIIGLENKQLADELDHSINVLRKFLYSLETPVRNSARATESVRSLGVYFDDIPVDEWKEFTNVYHIHYPTVNLNNSSRNVRSATSGVRL